jgi:hypothetical protein
MVLTRLKWFSIRKRQKDCGQISNSVASVYLVHLACDAISEYRSQSQRDYFATEFISRHGNQRAIRRRVMKPRIFRPECLMLMPRVCASFCNQNPVFACIFLCFQSLITCASHFFPVPLYVSCRFNFGRLVPQIFTNFVSWHFTIYIFRKGRVFNTATNHRNTQHLDCAVSAEFERVDFVSVINGP